MENEPSSTPDLANIDLSLSFAPSWVKETGVSKEVERLAAKHGDRPERPERRGGNNDRRPDRPRQDRPQGRREGGGKPRGNDRDRRAGRDDRNRPAPEPRPVPIAALSGWLVKFLPHPTGIEGLAKQIKSTSKTYPLFDLARLVLDKSERYQLELEPESESAQKLYQLRADGSLWLRESEAIAYALEKLRDKYYRTERIETEAPKGNHTFVAVCGMSGEILGPTNFHDYQEKIRRIHAKQFANMHFEAYKSRIRIERDPAVIEKWKESQSSKDVYYPLDTPEGAEPVMLQSLSEVETHFRTHYAASAVEPVTGRITVPGPVAMNGSAPGVLELTRGNWEILNRHPLPMVHILSGELASKGLQIFKTPDNITYVGVARPKYLDRQAAPVSERLESILKYLEANAKTPRAEQWKALLELYPEPAEGSPTRESALAADLLWLLHEGHVIDYAGKGLVATAKPGVRVEGKDEKH